MKLRIFSILMLLITVGYRVKAQSCTETLNTARQNFEEGHLYIIEGLLEPCLKKGFNRDQKIEAYYLLTRTYLFIDEPEKAEESYLNLLKLDPEYKPDPETAPIDLVYLSEKFTTTPIFTLHGGIGPNVSTIHVLGNYGVDNTAESRESYKEGVGVQIRLGADLNINSHFSLGIEPTFVTRSYSYKNILFMVDEQNYTENQALLQLPVVLKYRIEKNKWRPFVYAGFGAEFLINARAQITYYDKNQDSQTEFPVTGPELNISKIRKRLNSYVLFGVGTNYRIGYNYIYIDARYSGQLRNMVHTDNQYNIADFDYTYGYIDDDKRLSNYAITVGYVWPLYKPRKLRKYTKEGFFSQIFRNE